MKNACVCACVCLYVCESQKDRGVSGDAVIWVWLTFVVVGTFWLQGCCYCTYTGWCYCTCVPAVCICCMYACGCAVILPDAIYC